MEQNRFAHGAFAPAAADEHAGLHPISNPDSAEPDSPHAFATLAEEDAYWAGVADGIRNAGGTVPPRLAARAAGQRLLVDTAHDAAAADPDDVLAFTPTDLRHRHDGWTPQRQRAFVEALADTGLVREAAARVGMTEQSVNRLRRRADAIPFNRACEAALRMSGPRLVSLAYQRAIEGTIKRHYFRGELKAEERVYDNRLLIALINKLPAETFAPTPETEEVAANWEPWLDAIEEGRRVPLPLTPDQAPEGARVWDCDGDGPWTDCVPPAGFDGIEEGQPTSPAYERSLTVAELEWWEKVGRLQATPVLEHDEIIHYLGRWTLFPWGPEPSEPSAEAAKPEGEVSGAHEPSGESRPGADGGSPSGEPDRRRGFAAAPTAGSAKPEGEGSKAHEPSGESRPGADGRASDPAEEPDRRHGFAGTASPASPEHPLPVTPASSEHPLPVPPAKAGAPLPSPAAEARTAAEEEAVSPRLRR
jgi:hypothetical protein